MLNQTYSIFLSCFPDTCVSKEDFERILDFKHAKLITHFSEDKDVLIGFAVVRENCISLLCVAPADQNQGIGTDLLLEAESMIKNDGYDEILLGHKFDESSLLMGVPIVGNNNREFFEKHQYDSDYNIFDVSMTLLDKEMSRESGNTNYIVIDTRKLSDMRNVCFELIKLKDPFFYEKYFADENKNYLFIKEKEEILGACAYKIFAETGQMEMDDLIAYPNFNLQVKRALLYTIKQLQRDCGLAEIIVKGLSNPVLYMELCGAEIKERYWRGSKSC